MIALTLAGALSSSASANEFEDGYAFAGSAYLADSWGVERTGGAALARNGIGGGVAARGGAGAFLEPLYLGAAMRLRVGLGGQSTYIDVGDSFWSDVSVEFAAQVGFGSEDGGVIVEFGTDYRRDSAVGEKLGRRTVHPWMTRVRAAFAPVDFSLEWAPNRHVGAAAEIEVDEDSGFYVGLAADSVRFAMKPEVDGVLWMGGTTGARGTFYIGVKY